MPTLFVDQLTVVDCALLDRARGLVGASWITDIVLEGALDEQGMLFDFGPAKQAIKRIIDTSIDHKLIVPRRVPGLAYRQEDDTAELEFTDTTGARLRLGCPPTALALLDATAADPETVAGYLERELTAAMPANVTNVSVRLRDEAIEGASYSYCHGLKKHAGNCQRIAHGHRSRLEIQADGARSPELERRWAEGWRDVFLGNRADLVNDPGEARYRFAYEADEGRFELELPAARCDLLDADTTVENIAAHIARELKRRQPRRRFTVRAYEGVNKGAVAAA